MQEKKGWIRKGFWIIDKTYVLLGQVQLILCNIILFNDP